MPKTPNMMSEREQILIPVLKQVIDKFDPEHLLSIGSPMDEYDPEIQEAAQGLSCLGRVSDLSVWELSNLLALVFHRAYRQWTEQVVYHSLYTEMAEMLKPMLQGLQYPTWGTEKVKADTESDDPLFF